MASRSLFMPTRVPHLAAAAGIALMLSACGERAETPAAGVPCGSDPTARQVVVEIRYDAQGMPSASPDTCEVEPGTAVTWQGPDGNPAVFELVFQGAAPASRAPPGPWTSASGGGRQRIQQRLDGRPGRYKYDIRANGRTRDPAIIIR